MSMTIAQAKSELMQIYGMLSPDKQRAIDTLVKIEPKTDVSEYDIDHIWYKGGQYISLRRFLKVKAEAEQEPCEDCISRKSIKQKLQEHHDFFVNAYGGFSNLSQNDKSRVDEIINCIAMVVNEPPVNPQEPKTGRWIEEDVFDGDVAYRCSECNELFWIESGTPKDNEYNFCPKCGAKMESEVSE